MNQPEYDQTMRLTRLAARADLTDRLVCLGLALLTVSLVFAPLAVTLHGLLAHLPELITP